MQPKMIRLQRLRKDTGRIDTMVQDVAVWPNDYQRIWRWIGGENGVAHPHPLACYWIEAIGEESRITGDEHLVLSEN